MKHGPMTKFRKVLLIVDNLRIGGIERNVLDQAYLLSDFNVSVTILVLDGASTINNINFLELEKKFISKNCLEIIQNRKGKITAFSKLYRLIRQKKYDLVIDNTLTASFIISIIKVLTLSKIRVHTVVQQFISLSATKQRFKRMFYAQFTNHLIINSINYKNDWDFHSQKSLLTKCLFFRKSSVIRNGVYLPRLNLNMRLRSPISLPPRFIFLGRLKDWKGLSNLGKLDKYLDLSASFLIYTPNASKEQMAYIKEMLGDRVEFIFGKTLINYEPQNRDVHVYPVEYPKGFKAIESISTNVLEMTLMGVPSMVTENGSLNWEELRLTGLIKEVDWNSKVSVLDALEELKFLNFNSINFDMLEMCCNISRNLQLHEYLCFKNK